MFLKSLIVAALGVGACAWAQSGALPQSTPPTAPAPAPLAKATDKVAAIGEFATADALLLALETADRDLKSLSSDLLWTKEFFLGGDTHTRQGKLFFVDQRPPGGVDAGTKEHSPRETQHKPVAPAGMRKFAVRIEATQFQGEGANAARLDRKVQEYVFDGSALVERFPDEKRIVRHQLNAKAGTDPLKIGEGPIPLPVGQKREDILARFNVELLSAEKDLVPEGTKKDDPQAQQLLALVKGSAQLKLVPRPEYERECAFKEARLWYQRSTVVGEHGRLLPRMARAVNKQDDTDTVLLTGVLINGPVEQVFDAGVPAGWEEQVIGAGA